MMTEIVTVSEDASYRAIVDLLAEHRISAVPVVDATRVVVGVVSEADLLYKVEFGGGDGHPRRPSRARRRSPRDKSQGRIARELMTTPAVTTGPNTSLAEAARLMDRRAVKRLPVVDDAGILVGLVSRADLLRVHLRPDGEMRREVVDVLGRALWIVPSAVDVEARDGVVTLRGRLETRSLAGLAGNLVAAVPGVVAVENQLTYERVDDAAPEGSRRYRSYPFSITGRPV
jgi:CBS domain-containing protein